MPSPTTMLHVRVDQKLKSTATRKLSHLGLTVSDAVRILLTRVVRDGALPPGLTADADSYDAWFREKVREALADKEPTVPHAEAMAAAQSVIDRRRRARG